jgi:hypothetical protein
MAYSYVRVGSTRHLGGVGQKSSKELSELIERTNRPSYACEGAGPIALSDKQWHSKLHPVFMVSSCLYRAARLPSPSQMAAAKVFSTRSPPPFWFYSPSHQNTALLNLSPPPLPNSLLLFARPKRKNASLTLYGNFGKRRSLMM